MFLGAAEHFWFAGESYILQKNWKKPKNRSSNAPICNNCSTRRREDLDIKIWNCLYYMRSDWYRFSLPARSDCLRIWFSESDSKMPDLKDFGSGTANTPHSKFRQIVWFHWLRSSEIKIYVRFKHISYNCIKVNSITDTEYHRPMSDFWKWLIRRNRMDEFRMHFLSPFTTKQRFRHRIEKFSNWLLFRFSERCYDQCVWRMMIGMQKSDRG